MGNIIADAVFEKYLKSNSERSNNKIPFS